MTEEELKPIREAFAKLLEANYEGDWKVHLSTLQRLLGAGCIADPKD